MPRTLPVYHPPYNSTGAPFRKKLLFSMLGTTVDICRLPPYASVYGGGVHVLTANNDSGTSTINIGFRQGYSTDDPDAYATLLDLKTIGFKALDELAAITNIIQTSAVTVTATGVPQNSNATAGACYVTILFSVGSYDGQ
jgi:hypothetical protein